MEIYGSILIISSMDNVAVALEHISSGTNLIAGSYNILTDKDIPAAHKVALKDIAKGGDIIKYGFSIGHALKDIKAGEYVHTHNLATNLAGILNYEFKPAPARSQIKKEGKFRGFVRENGSIGIRNEIWIVNTVGCVNKTAEKLSNLAGIKYSGFTDGIFHFPHPFGCSQLGEDHKMTQKILKGLVNHPNAAGVLILGLGCENNNINEFKKFLCEYNPERVKFMSTQDTGDEIADGLLLINDLVEYANKFTRQEVPLSRLIVGLKCGGSDAFSGITANPLVGEFTDLLIQHGGSAILTEVPEMFGAETILMNRCKDIETFGNTVNLINRFKQYFTDHGQNIYENPSPGNKEGGITTLEEKSLGCILKGGTSNINGILDMTENVSKPGLNLLNGPGNDMVSTTLLTASGAHLILFTTGRGNPFGAPVPTIKISSSSTLFDKKKNWIDFNAGQLLNGIDSGNLNYNLFEYILKVASGEIQTKCELNGYREIAIFKDGVTL